MRKGLARKVEPERVLKYIQYFWQDYYIKHRKLQINSLNSVLNEGQLAILLEKEEVLDILHDGLKPIEENLCDFEECLYDHVRWEERILFEEIQEKFGSTHLEKIISGNNDLDDWCELYIDQFWL